MLDAFSRSGSYAPNISENTIHDPEDVSSEIGHLIRMAVHMVVGRGWNVA